jgi:hypothetical protein
MRVLVLVYWIRWFGWMRAMHVKTAWHHTTARIGKTCVRVRARAVDFHTHHPRDQCTHTTQRVA